MASSTDNSSSWMSLCMAATSKLMDEKHIIIQSDATTDPESEDSAVASLMCFESMGSESPDSSISQPLNQGIKPRKGNTSQPVIKKKGRGPSKYLRGIPAVSKRDAAWNVMFRRLQEFKHEHGHCNVPQGYVADLELATWVKNQRQAYRYMLDKKGDKKPTKRISPDRVTRLNHLGFEWRKYVRSDEWKAPRAPRQKKQSKKGVVANTESQIQILPCIPMSHPCLPPPPTLTGISNELLCNETII